MNASIWSRSSSVLGANLWFEFARLCSLYCILVILRKRLTLIMVSRTLDHFVNWRLFVSQSPGRHPGRPSSAYITVHVSETTIVIIDCLDSVAARIREHNEGVRQLAWLLYPFPRHRRFCCFWF